MLIFGIESSCDETACAVVEDGRRVISSAVSSQIKDHRLYGGVVPEIASRLHVEAVCSVAEKAFSDAGMSVNDVDAVAVTYAPGLIGALLAGLGFAKGLAYSADKPLVPVHHLKGHIAALYLNNPELRPPFVALVASGGHSHVVHVKDYCEFEVLGRAVDDAAGEAFDKVARTLGLPYPGGVEVARLALTGDENKYKLPEPHTGGRYDMSFSGLKTAVINIVNQAGMKGEELDGPSLAASFQKRAVGMLAHRLADCSRELKLPAALCGGVAVNASLRDLAGQLCQKQGTELFLPLPEYCGDNAAMIAAAGYYELKNGARAPLSQNAFAAAEM